MDEKRSHPRFSRPASTGELSAFDRPPQASPTPPVVTQPAPEGQTGEQGERGSLFELSDVQDFNDSSPRLPKSPVSPIHSLSAATTPSSSGSSGPPATVSSPASTEKSPKRVQRTCYTCKKSIGPTDAAYMYKGWAFCTIECREAQIKLDEKAGPSEPVDEELIKQWSQRPSPDGEDGKTKAD